ncbi:hypothetical protein GO495_11790 [Chitinophaga oryziterrae]|uniref:Type VI secretion system contractile sheath small subunit n=1 Tax=Chitinophaga oryziterrae TaxID=1031224 RepID=A0A6N8J7Q3_9BACT|nr:hypothetical protein [Chitinophaga oryziterrae]MVT41267.1 hypothetical protein [Chitinophaga oryziterrae]
MNDNYGIGGNEVRLDANEAIIEISHNRTLFAEKLTRQTPVKPEIVQGLTTVEDVFENYKPSVNMLFHDAEGRTVPENLEFHNLGDFGVKGITAQSNFLNNLATEKEQYLKIMKHLKTNKVLKSALADPAARQALLTSVKSLLADLNNNK